MALIAEILGFLFAFWNTLGEQCFLSEMEERENFGFLAVGDWKGTSCGLGGVKERWAGSVFVLIL